MIVYIHDNDNWNITYHSYIRMVAEGAKKSPELIQLLELHTQFATITPYSQVYINFYTLDSH